MLYDITAKIVYEYEDAAVAGRHVLRLAPIDIPGEQRVLSQRLTVSPKPSERAVRQDFYGNDTVDVLFNRVHEEVEFKVSARVERLAESPSLDITPPLTALSAQVGQMRSLGPEAPHHYLGRSPRVSLYEAITAYTAALLSPKMTAWEAVHAIGCALHRDMKFDPEATTVDTSPIEAFEAREGVCQDFSHIMIAGLRGVGIPAAYVSGYLRTIPPEGKERLEGADAMHAWVRAWCGQDAGWIEFDPTNALMVAGDHVVVARGRDYSDVSPIKGILRTAGSQTSKQAVDVRPL